MQQINKHDADFFKLEKLNPNASANIFFARWLCLCETYLPFKETGTFWRFNRIAEPEEPSQGWKLHISATVLQACDLFEKIVPFLVSENVRFKAPETLRELINLNSGLKYGYWQVGKFLTIYPSAEKEAVRLAPKLHELTREFISIAVPFDNQYLPESSVFYRYGAFAEIEIKTEDNLTLPAVRNLSGELVYDDRFQPVPEWIVDPFQNEGEITEDDAENVLTPLVTTYKIFRAITQRGKGGIYQALDLSINPPRLCIVKEGRRYGEIFWNGQDGYHLVRNEQRVLKNLGKTCKYVPQIFSSFEAHDNYYLVMEYIEGVSLSNLMKFRQRRFSIKQVVIYTSEIARIIEDIHNVGWVWNDCKPENLIVAKNQSLRPIDFENSYPVNQTAPFDWKSHRFSKPGENQSSGKATDLYALGAILYFLLTGKFYKSDAPTPIKKLRRNVPERLIAIVNNLLDANALNENPAATEIRRELEKILPST